MKLLCVFSILFLAFAFTASSDSIVLKGGYVRPTGGNDLLDLNGRPTTLKRDALDGLTGEVSYLHTMGDRFSIGGNVGYYNSDTQLDELDFNVNDGDDTPRRNVELRIIPIEFAAQFLPVGEGRFTPYVGGGVGAYVWKYREQGLFLTNPGSPTPIFRQGLATSDNTDFGWHVEGGVRFPISHSVAVLGEAKYFQVQGDLTGTDSELDDLFTTGTPKIDLNQVTLTGGFAFSF
ncbi:MAG TPA: outer membrane beta-barrel protein [Acidobacteriota bacterium]|nr:outer membrane beta-barrel protein [Acidobacteriota bacterium]